MSVLINILIGAMILAVLAISAAIFTLVVMIWRDIIL